MTRPITLTIDGREIQATQGQTVLEAATKAGVYIPRLCAFKDLSPYGSCRVCTVFVNGRPSAACIQPAMEGMIIESDTEEVNAIRRDLVDMLFVEGNHYCMYCEKSGHCELQAMAYRLGITAPRFPYMFPKNEIDMTHPDVYLDRDRCIRCARCVRASREVDEKAVFGFVGRGAHRELGINADGPLGESRLDGADAAVKACPVGSLMPKRVAYRVPIGERPYDDEPIGTDIVRAAADQE